MPAPALVAAAKFAGKAAVNAAAKRTPGGLLGLVAIVVVGSFMASMMIMNAFLGMVTSAVGAATDDECGSFSPAPSTVAGIPAVALEAYQKAAQASGVDWSFIAAIGKHESGHGSANGATLGADGSALPMIKTPPLNGSGFGGNTTPMPYHGEGNIDGWDHGVGPMQFLLSTWYGGMKQDGNLDGKKDPNNIYDAALATGLYLKSLGAPGDMDRAIFGYNRSSVYVAEIKASAAEYRSAGESGAQANPPAPVVAADQTAGGGGGSEFGNHSTLDLGPSQPQTITVANTLAPMFKIKDVGGYRPGDQDHGTGLALDFMVYKDKATGDALADYAQKNAAQLGIQYIIWYQQIWNVDRAKEGWRSMEDRGSPTQNHMDHVHISLTGKPGTGLTDSASCGFLPGGATGTGAANEGKNELNAWGGYSNGKIPISVLCPISYSPVRDHLRCDAAQAFEQMNVSYKGTFGTNIAITDTYRPYEEQVSVYATSRPGFAAKPGTSNHGWALATDLGGGINQFGSSQYNWMKANAPKFGFIHPSWAEPGGSAPEPWHWVYTG